jgi:FkbM family methyltransferase
MSFHTLKRFVKKFFNIFDIDIRRIPKSEREELLWLKDYNINTIFDVGANNGRFLLKIKKLFPNTIIYSFEPVRGAFNELSENTKGMNHVQLYNIALGDFNGKSIIYRHDDTEVSSLLKATQLKMKAYPHIGKGVEENIEVKRLDDFIIENNIKMEDDILIKLDVQGFEDKVIFGGIETFKKVKIVITEVEFIELYEGQVLFDGIYKILNNLGFKFKGTIGTALNPLNGMPFFADAVFIRDS